MRTLAIGACFVLGCSSVPARENDASAIDAAATDAFVGDAVTCSCRGGTYRATSSDGTIDYVFSLDECGPFPICRLGESAASLTTTMCRATSDGPFRVYVDESGFIELVFSATPCDAAWTGQYASEGASPVAITATRVP